jgi:excisionase family DNA binding protein
MADDKEFDKIYTPSQVASLFNVDPKTVGRWMSAGKLGHIKTPGGTRRITDRHINAVSSGVCRGCSTLKDTSGGCSCG